MDRAVLSSCKHTNSYTLRKVLLFNIHFYVDKAESTYLITVQLLPLWFHNILNGKTLTNISLCFCNIISETKMEWFTAWRQQAHRSNDSHTLSVRVASQSGCANSSLTMSAWPCSLAHISAVEPSSSWRLTSAPCARSACTMSILPWLTASIRAVWPAWTAEGGGQTQEMGLMRQSPYISNISNID